MKLPDFLKFLDSDYASKPLSELMSEDHKVSPSRWMPFVVLHLLALSVIFTGVSTEALALCFWLYFLRMFAITGFYHRYFSHRSFKTSRAAQFCFAWLGATAVQRGPLWWASHHRHHHRYSDKENDTHSPVTGSFLWSHMGWITSERNIPTDYSRVEDLKKFPELVFINRFDWLPGILLGLSVFILGEWMKSSGHAVSGAQFLAWGLVSTIFLYHGTFCINSVAHLFGTRRFNTDDDSRNNFLLALVTLGEGWHNNHHRFPGSTRQGYTWWELDITYLILKVMEMLGIVWDVSTQKDVSSREKMEPASEVPSVR